MRILYDFEALKERFTDMTDIEIMREYVSVIAELEYIEEHLDFEAFCIYSEPLTEAERYLSGYLARKVCYEAGIEVYPDSVAV